MFGPILLIVVYHSSFVHVYTTVSKHPMHCMIIAIVVLNYAQVRQES